MQVGAFIGLDVHKATISAVTVLTKAGDLHLFDNPRQLMASPGLTPSEHLSGASLRGSGITKEGGGLARRVLIEGAWRGRMQARFRRKLHNRIEILPEVVPNIAWKGHSDNPTLACAPAQPCLSSVSYLAHRHQLAPGGTGILAMEQGLDDDPESGR